jgi:hypothetical protein
MVGFSRRGTIERSATGVRRRDDDGPDNREHEWSAALRAGPLAVCHYREVLKVEVPPGYGAWTDHDRLTGAPFDQAQRPAVLALQGLLPHCMSANTAGTRSRPFSVRRYS